MLRTIVEQLAFDVPRGLGSRVRVLVYRRLGMHIGEHCRLEQIRLRRPRQIRLGTYNSFTAGCWLWPDNSASDCVRIEIGNHNYFNRDVMIDACGSIRIGDYNMFGPRVYITDSNHKMGPHQWVGNNPMDRGEVIIGNGCWIGCGAILLKGVQLGDRCIVGAGAVVTKSFGPGAIVVGVPARQIQP